MLGVYARWGGPVGERVAAETADFLRCAETGTAKGGSPRRSTRTPRWEGRFYVGPLRGGTDPGTRARDGTWAAGVFEVTAAGTFEDGASTLQLLGNPDDPERLADVRARLLAAREERVRPERDDKVVAAWNGQADRLDVRGGAASATNLVAVAKQAGALLRTCPATTRSLLRVSRDDLAGPRRGVLEDHGCVAGGFLALAGVTGDRPG